MLTSLYIHIPFCSQICSYCDFHKEIAKQSKKERYIDALISELFHHKQSLKTIKSIYIGGGTPTSLDLVLLEKLLMAINETINLDSIFEYSIESNPNDYTIELVQLLKKYGVNRVSIGVQTFDQAHLSFLGRTHQEIDVLNAVTLLRNNGFSNISVDMMFSLINQTEEELRLDLEKVIALNVDHISYYSLILEEKTKLQFLLKQNKISMNSEDTEGLMYNIVIDTLVNNGFEHYEISNFSKINKQSFHNKTYWLNKEYLGIGSGSHSMYNKSRYYNPHNVTKYITMLENNDFNIKTSYEYDSLNEELMLSLRLIKGINIEEINQKYQIDLFKKYPELIKYINQKILKVDNGNLCFTREGILLGNLVFQIFVEVL